MFQSSGGGGPSGGPSGGASGGASGAPAGEPSGGAARGPAGKEEKDEEKGEEKEEEQEEQEERVYLSPVLVPILDMFNHRSMSSLDNTNTNSVRTEAPLLSINQHYFELVAMKSYALNVWTNLFISL